MKEEVVDSLFVTWLTLLGIAYLSLALPHCTLNSPTFVPLLGEMINHLRPLMPHLIQEQALLVFLMGKKFPRIPCPILYYGLDSIGANPAASIWFWNWHLSRLLPMLAETGLGTSHRPCTAIAGRDKDRRMLSPVPPRQRIGFPILTNYRMCAIGW